MEKTDKEVLELCQSWFKDIMERSEKLTSGNVAHGRAAIRGVAKNYADSEYWNGKADAYRDMLVALDTIEVKEVDFEKIWKEYFEYMGDVATVNVKHLAKHFFERGLKARGD